MRTLDQSRSYAEVCGAIGAMFEQDGMLFKADGTQALDIEQVIEEIAPDDSGEILSTYCIEQKSEPNEIIETGSRNLEDMHWRHLKALVEVYGGVWESKEKAIAFMKGKA